MRMPVLLLKEIFVHIAVVDHLVAMVLLHGLLGLRGIVEPQDIGRICVWTDKFSTDEALAAGHDLVGGDFVGHEDRITESDA